MTPFITTPIRPPFVANGPHLYIFASDISVKTFTAGTVHKQEPHINKVYIIEKKCCTKAFINSFWTIFISGDEDYDIKIVLFVYLDFAAFLYARDVILLLALS